MSLQVSLSFRPVDEHSGKSGQSCLSFLGDIVDSYDLSLFSLTYVGELVTYNNYGFMGWKLLS